MEDVKLEKIKNETEIGNKKLVTNQKIIEHCQMFYRMMRLTILIN